METQNLTYSFVVDQTPQEVFDAINNVRGWWSGNIEGTTDKLSEEWTYRYKDVHYSRQRIEELVPGRKVVWLVLEGHLNIVANKTEWTGTKIIFEISAKGDKTELVFTHIGLVPEAECYEVCSNAWGGYINGSLRNLITTGAGQPNKKE